MKLCYYSSSLWKKQAPLTLYVEKGLGRLQFAVVVAHLALVLAQVAHHSGIDAQAAVGTDVGSPHQILDLLQQHSVLVPGGLRVIRVLHHAVEEGGLSLLDGLVHGRDSDEGPTLDRQMVGGSIVADRGRAIGEAYLAVVPALVRFADGSQIDGGSSELRMVLHQVQSAIEELVGGGLLLIPGEDFLALWVEYNHKYTYCMHIF